LNLRPLGPETRNNTVTESRNGSRRPCRFARCVLTADWYRTVGGTDS